MAWQFIEGLVRATPNEVQAENLYIGFLVAFHICMVAGLHFILIFVGRRTLLSHPLIELGVPFVGFSFIFLNAMGQIVPDLALSDFWGWKFVPTRTIYDFAQISWISLLGLVFFTLLAINFISKSKNGQPTKAALLMLVAYAVPVVVGVICQVTIPYVFGYEEIPLTSVSMTVFTVATFFAIRNYKILEFSKIAILDNLVHTITEGIMIVDDQNRIQYINDISTQITGFTEAEVLGKKAMEVFVEDQNELNILKKEIQERKMQNAGSYDIKIKTRSNKTIWLNVVGIPYYDNKGKVIGSIGLHKDITERKEAELLLKSYDRTLRSLVESTNEAIIVINNENRITLANNGAETLFEYSFQEIANKKVSDLFPDLNNEKVSVSHRTGLYSEESDKKVIEERALTKSGKELIVELSLAPMNTDSGEHTSFIIRDVTLRVKYEAKLESINNELNTLIYKASHDLRGPVASIKGLVNLYDKPNNTLEERTEYFEMIKSCTTQLDNILTDLTEVNRITHEEMEVAEFSLLAEIRKIIHQLKDKEDPNNIEFFIDFKYNEFIQVDQKLLDLILQNTINNAIMYSDPRKDNSQVTVRVTDAEDGYLIEVIDNGLGMDQVVQDRAYNMFYRGISSSKGAGLGLYLARKAVMKIGGYIMIESEKGEGTTVKIFIPAMQSEAKVVSLTAS